MVDIFQKAISEVVDLVSRGVVYPEAHMRVAIKYNLSPAHAKILNDQYNTALSK